jgi:hypothetical protein
MGKLVLQSDLYKLFDSQADEDLQFRTSSLQHSRKQKPLCICTDRPLHAALVRFWLLLDTHCKQLEV